METSVRGKIGVRSILAFAAALAVLACAALAARLGAVRLAEAGPSAHRAADFALASARDALEAFDAWRAADGLGASRRADQLEARFLKLLDRAGDRAASVAAQGAVAAVRDERERWRAAPPLDPRFAAFEPALEEARAAAMRLKLAYLVELSLTESLSVRRAAVSSASHVALASVVAALAALLALALVVRHIVLLVFVPARHPRTDATPLYDLDSSRRKAAARAKALRDFQTDRRLRTDLPFALRGSAPTLFEG